MTTLEVTGQDVSHDPPICRRFSITADTGEMQLQLDDCQAILSYDDWNPLLLEVRQKSLTRWQSDNPPPPFDLPEMHAMVRRIDSTPSYQLFLAAVEIANAARLVQLSQDADVERFWIIVFSTLNNRSLGNVRQGRLYFLPLEETVEMPELVSTRLIELGKVCEVNIERGDRRFRNFYIPYATPVTAVHEFGRDSYQYWSRLKDLKAAS